MIRNSQIVTTTDGSGTAGEVELQAPTGLITLIGDTDTGIEGVFTEASAGSAGSIEIIAMDLTVKKGAQISARTDTGRAGDININQSGDNPASSSLNTLIVRDETSRITARARRNGGEAGFIAINAQNIQVENDGIIEASSVSSNATAVDSGVRFQNVDTLIVTGGGQINVETNRGRAGNVDINTGSTPARLLILDGNSSRISARATARNGDSGQVEIHAQDIRVQNGARITAANRFNNERSINNQPLLSELLLEDVTSLQVLNGGQISVRTRTGTAGNVEINQNSDQPLDTLIVDGGDSRITARAIGNQGDAGQIIIRGRNIRVSDRAQITAANISSDDSQVIGNIALEGVEALEVLAGGEISVRTRTGTAGNVEINQAGSQPVQALVVNGNDSLITAQALQTGGRAGGVAINAQTILVDNLGQITAANVGPDNNSGNPRAKTALTFTNVDSLEVLNGGQISVLTQQGTAGNIEIGSGENHRSPGQTPTLLPSIRVEGTGSAITAETGSRSGTTQAGNISITTRTLTVNDGGSITVSSPNGVAGNLELNVPFIVLDDGELRAEIGSKTASDTGAEINFSGLASLLMRNNSLISASATNGATGGNLIFGTPENPVGFIGAPSNSNSDIIATAQQGQGGNITLRVAQIEGFTVRNTPFVRNNVTNDISASSSGGPQGTVVLDTPSVNPLRSLINLPGALVEVPVLAGICQPQSQGQSEFIQVGRGGLPRQPADVLGPGHSSTPWVNRESTIPSAKLEDQELTPRAANVIPTTSFPQQQPNYTVIEEAQGWMTDPQGNIMLTVHASAHTTPDASGAIAQTLCTP